MLIVLDVQLLRCGCCWDLQSDSQREGLAAICCTGLFPALDLWLFTTVVRAERAQCVPVLCGGSADFIKPEGFEQLADVSVHAQSWVMFYGENELLKERIPFLCDVE